MGRGAYTGYDVRPAQAALWWGPLIGGATAFMGSIVPAWSVRSVKVSEVFSKIS